MNRQGGQTLIETLVAIFILVMGVTAALALANYSLGATSNIRQQTIAMGLSREGIEAVKNMRDTNWLRATPSTACYNFESGTNIATCYPTWLTADKDISAGGGTKSFFLTYTAAGSRPWDLISPATPLYGLDFNPNVSNSVYYNVTAQGKKATLSNSGFARKITIEEDRSTDPFTIDKTSLGPRLIVTSVVWWGAKGCVMADDIDDNYKCQVKLQTYLTNWKNF